MRIAFLIALLSITASAQFPPAKYNGGAVADRAAAVSKIIDTAVDPAHLPTGFKGTMIGYLDDYGIVYKPYGVATVDGTVAMNERTVFGIGSATKLFAATLLAIANQKGLALNTPVVSLLPPENIASTQNRYSIRLLDLADHHAGLPKNEGHLFSSLADLYKDYAADPITCVSSTSELIHDCGCCDPVYMSLLGGSPTCGTGVASPVYTCATHAPTLGLKGFVYSNLAFEVLGPVVATWLGYSSWNQANLQEITEPLDMPDTLPLESFGASQIARAADHCSPATRTTNVNCQLLDWLPVGNAGGGLFSTARDMLQFVGYNAFATTPAPVNSTLVAALPVIHQNYEASPTGGQELAWQTKVLRTGELMRWKDGSNGPFNSWTAYVAGPSTRGIVLLDNNGQGTGALDLATIGTEILTNTGPVITSVSTANGGPDIAQNTWTVIKGSNLVPPATVKDGVIWNDAPDFASGRMPTKLGNVSVSVNGKPAFVYFYCSAATSNVCTSDQINVLSPLDTTTGSVQVVVTSGPASSSPFAVNLKTLSPAFLLFNQQGYIAGRHGDNSLIGPTTLYPGSSTPAKPGEEVALYGVGFGLAGNTLVNGSSSQSGSLPSLPVCNVAGAQARLTFAGLSGAGLYQINLVVPTDAAAGDNSVVCTYGGVSTPTGAILTVQP